VIYTDEQREFLESHRWAVLATGRQDGSPQQSMVGYTIDGEGRILISSQTFTAKVRNTRRLPRVSLTVPDGRVHVAVYGTAEIIENDPERAELSADVARRRPRAGSPGPGGDRALARPAAAHRRPHHARAGLQPRVTRSSQASSATLRRTGSRSLWP
jgi:PPOX class probable F420-dependent enzyme